MFAVIYKFNVKLKREDDFILAWSKLTKLIYSYEGSLGSRLHRNEDGSFIAYAQWPQEHVWENSGSKLPKTAEAWKMKMRDACHSIDVIEKMDVVEDILKDKIA